MTRTVDRLVIALPDVAERHLLGPLPLRAAVVLFAESVDALWPDLSEVEVIVPGIVGRHRFAAGIAGMPRLRLIQTVTAGVDFLRGRVPPEVTVCNARGAFDAGMAEWVVGAILAFRRGLLVSRDAQAEHAWRPTDIALVEGATVVVLGLGSIGSAVAHRLRPFGVDLVGVGRTARPGVAGLEDLDALLPRADVLVDLLPLTADTLGFLDARRLALLPDGALLVNAGRGRTVDTAALVAEASSGRISAALDVTDPEPLPPDHPLWAMPNVLVTPHIAGDSPAGVARAWAIAAEGIGRYAAGQEPATRVPDYLLR